MKPKFSPRLELSRIRHPLTNDPGDSTHGCFFLKAPSGRFLFIIATNGEEWDHVSVSIRNSHDTPTWEEMIFVKDQIFEPEETVVQYHPPKSKYVNIDAGCLHLWRPQKVNLPMPPLILV